MMKASQESRLIFKVSGIPSITKRASSQDPEKFLSRCLGFEVLLK